MSKEKQGNRRDAEATKAELIAAAEPIFAEKGFEGCRTQTVADAAGANKAMISYHFGGKLGLYRAVIEAAMDVADPLIDQFTRSTTGLDERMGAWIHTLQAIFNAKPHLPAILMREHLGGGRHLQSEFRQRISRFFMTTRSIVEDKGVSADPHIVHLSLIGAVTFYLVSEPFRTRAAAQGMDWVSSPSQDDYFQYLITLFDEGLKPFQPLRK